MALDFIFPLKCFKDLRFPLVWLGFGFVLFFNNGPDIQMHDLSTYSQE